MDDHLPRRGGGMAAQRTGRWAVCPYAPRRPQPQVVDYLRSCLDEAAGITGDFSAEHLEAILDRARVVVRRERLRTVAAMTTMLVGVAFAGYVVGTVL